MTEEQKDRLRELIDEVVVANREYIWEESRWDSTRRARDEADKHIDYCKQQLETFIQGL